MPMSTIRVSLNQQNRTPRLSLPPLILHPFAGREGPDKLLEGSRAALMLHGLVPTDVDIDELGRRKVPILTLEEDGP